MTHETWISHLSSYLPVLAAPVAEGRIGLWKNRDAGPTSLTPPDTWVAIDELESAEDWRTLVCDRLEL